MNQEREIVSLEYRVNKSFEGKYFIGHTPILSLQNNSNAWGGLINPMDSCVNIFLNTFTVTNYSSTPFPAQLWLNASPIGNAKASNHVTAANTAINPVRKPVSYLLYAQNVHYQPSDGVSIFTRISEANSTVVGNYYGKIVIPPGGSVITYLEAPDCQQIDAEIAYGWWEEKI